ncbi:uncharacterized protein A4U43_C09F5770 [Asparagus officinalis]|uniref:Uncharacterized protein n=1 Tax=Asparagus officinalis TaxID=4686 RepID=A0A5P1E7E1_ASPOF|nr:uncharacterized protein A4U43_C09F5770 [Asparagus officinalis]
MTIPSQDPDPNSGSDPDPSEHSATTRESLESVLVASARNWRVALPGGPKELYELDLGDYSKNGKYRIDSTRILRLVSEKLCA